MKRFKKVVIIGVGLIGGSVGLALKKRRLAREVVGVGRRRSSLIQAKKMGAVDRTTLSLANGLKGAELIIIATPVGKVISFLKKVAALAPAGAIVTDVASTKKMIVDEAEQRIKKDLFFVGGHPLAGSEKRGVRNAGASLFKGAVTILTVTKDTSNKALLRVVELWTALGAGVAIFSPEEHDRLVARISHLPHIAASALVGMAEEKELTFAGSGFRDITRIASSDPGLWKDIYLSNRNDVIKALDRFISTLKRFRNLVARREKKTLLKEIASAKELRDRFLR